MDVSKKTYSCFSEQGEVKLPSQEEISKKISAGIEPVIFLDSCVCLHIIKVVDYGRQATGVNQLCIVTLKEYLSKHPEN